MPYYDQKCHEGVNSLIPERQAGNKSALDPTSTWSRYYDKALSWEMYAVGDTYRLDNARKT